MQDVLKVKLNFKFDIYKETTKLEFIYPAAGLIPEERFTYLTGQMIVKRDITEI